MKVVELTNVLRRESPLHYRRAYTATAVLADEATNSETVRIEFVLEHSPLGPIDIRVKLLEETLSPAEEAVSALRAHVDELEQRGALP